MVMSVRNVFDHEAKAFIQATCFLVLETHPQADILFSLNATRDDVLENLGPDTEVLVGRFDLDLADFKDIIIVEQLQHPDG